VKAFRAVDLDSQGGGDDFGNAAMIKPYKRGTWEKTIVIKGGL
jgi:hypothetical protein